MEYRNFSVMLYADISEIIFNACSFSLFYNSLRATSAFQAVTNTSILLEGSWFIVQALKGRLIIRFLYQCLYVYVLQRKEFVVCALKARKKKITRMYSRVEGGGKKRIADIFSLIYESANKLDDGIRPQKRNDYRVEKRRRGQAGREKATKKLNVSIKLSRTRYSTSFRARIRVLCSLCSCRRRQIKTHVSDTCVLCAM